MATIAKNYLDLTGLSAYDALIKKYADDGDAKAIKTVLWDSTNEQIKFYKKENATLEDTADYSVSISSSDVAALKTRVGMDSTLNSYESKTNLTDIMNVLTGDNATAGSVAKAAADAVSTAEGYTDTAIAALDADLDASGTAQHGGTFVVSGVTEVDGKLTAVDSVEVEAAGAAAAAVDALDVNEFALASESDGVVTIKGIKEVDGKIAIGDGAGISLGTAAKADKATSAIQEESTDNNLVSAAQVSAFVAQEIAGLEGAMHFRGVITRQEGETDLEAIARVITKPQSGDVVVMSDNAKEYIYNGTAWREVGDETEFVKKTTTIAGVDLEDNITKTELLTALNVADGAQVNVLESVKVNGSALSIDANKAVDVTVVEGSTNGTVAVNGSDVAVHGLGSAAYEDTTAFDAAGTAAGLIANLGGSADIASVTGDVITIKGGVTEAGGVVSNSSADDVTISPISTTAIQNLFNANSGN